MTLHEFQKAVTLKVQQGFSRFAFFPDSNVPKEGVRTGYVTVRWNCGTQEAIASGLEGGVLVVAFQVYGPKGEGDGAAGLGAQELVDLFHAEPELVGPSSAEGHANLRRYAIDHLGSDSRGYYRVDVALIFDNYTSTPY